MFFEFDVLFAFDTFDEGVVCKQHVIDLSLMEDADLGDLEIDRVFIVVSSEMEKNENKRIGNSDSEVRL